MKVLIKEKISPHKSKTPEGYLICRDAVLARTGTQEYHKNEIFSDYNGEDVVVNVIRDSKEVFSQEAIASFENKPVTCEHPEEDVTPDNYKDYAVGFVRDVHKGTVDGQEVLLGNLIITDADCINDIENGIRTDLSCGYTCDITDEKEPRQVNIRGNHVALCEQGRAGVAHIVDSAGGVEYVKGLIFQSDKDIPAKSKFDLDEGLYKVGSKTYILVFHSGTHEVKQRELEKKYGAENFESFSTSVVGDKADTRDFRQLRRYSALCPKLIMRATGYFGLNRITDEKEDEKMATLPTKLKNKISHELAKMSKFVHDPNYDAYTFIKDLGERFYVDGRPLTFTREKIDGWNRMGDGMMRKDYTFSVDGYDNSFLVSVYADPDTYDTTEVNAYFLDSVQNKTKDCDDTCYDTYRGYDIDLVEGDYEVTFNGRPVRFETYDAALDYIDDQLERTEAMLRDRAIRDREYTPFFKREVRKELAKRRAAVEEEEAPDDEQTRMKFRQTKNSLLRKLNKFIEEARGE